MYSQDEGSSTSAWIPYTHNEAISGGVRRGPSNLSVCTAEQTDQQIDAASAVHELRNALGPMTTAVALLEEPSLDADLLGTVREILARQTRCMARLIDDLWDCSRSREGKLTLRLQPLDLARVVRETCEGHHHVFLERNMRLGMVLPQEPVIVIGDAGRLAQALTNLLLNAAKFTNSGGHVTVTLLTDPSAGRAFISVRDTGVGIEPHVIGQLFDRCFQDDCFGQQRDGLGLGLSLVKALIERHGGRVWAASQGLGHGAEFQFWIPLQPNVASTP